MRPGSGCGSSLPETEHPLEVISRNTSGYMLNGWDELLRSALPLCFAKNYRNDGRYTIDNLEAERTVRPITRARKSSLHHSSEEGLQMALAYMTIIESAKRLGHECKDFLVRAWKEAIYGNNDLEAMLQPVVVAK